MVRGKRELCLQGRHLNPVGAGGGPLVAEATEKRKKASGSVGPMDIELKIPGPGPVVGAQRELEPAGAPGLAVQGGEGVVRGREHDGLLLHKVS
jgi:hypothetical protein